MFFKILLVTAAVGWNRAAGADYNGDSSRSSSNYATPSPTPYAPEPPSHYSAESKSYKEDDRRSYDGPSHPRTGPPKKLGPGPLSFSGHGVPLGYPQRYLPPGSVIGYLAYPQPLVHGLPGGYSPLHDHAPGLLPSAAFSHIAYASPLTFSHYPKPIPLAPGPGPSYSSGGPGYSPGGPSYSSGPHSVYN